MVQFKIAASVHYKVQCWEWVSFRRALWMCIATSLPHISDVVCTTISISMLKQNICTFGECLRNEKIRHVFNHYSPVVVDSDFLCCYTFFAPMSLLVIYIFHCQCHCHSIMRDPQKKYLKKVPVKQITISCCKQQQR